MFFSRFRLFGSFDSAVRLYIIRDPEVFKRIAIKDFEYFQDHRVFIDDKMDELFGNSLFAMHGDKWRQMRATLSPAFTGSKIRQMFELVLECCDIIVTHLVKQIEKGEPINIEMKEFFSRYTNDVIASCAFGLKINSFDDPNNEFFSNSSKVMNFSGFKKSLQIFFTFVVPKISRLFNMRVFDESVTSVFKNIILDTMAQRKKHNIYRPDMVNMLMQLREGNSLQSTEEISDEYTTAEESDVENSNIARKWTDNELIAQCFLFFLAGFDTTSLALSFAAYELVANQNVQQKLYDEIVEVNGQLQGARLSFAILQNMKYMDQVISETLRKWPISNQIDRTCVKDYVYDDGERKFTIEKGSSMFLNVLGVHRNPKYFPNPGKFDPERFSDENIHHILPDTYIPFGAGRRNCIGKFHYHPVFNQ